MAKQRNHCVVGGIIDSKIPETFSEVFMSDKLFHMALILGRMFIRQYLSVKFS